MEFTTYFGLRSQATRLFETRIVRGELQVIDGTLTLSDALFQGNLYLGHDADNSL